MDKILRIYGFILGILYTVPAYCQQLSNGSFELNDLGCTANLMNAVFNAHVPGITAFGGQSEVDLLSDTCGYGAAAEGHYFAGLYNNGFSDAIAFGLSLPLQPEKRYKLRFACKLGTGFINQFSKAEVGLSGQAGFFVEPVYVTPVLDTSWQYYELQFSPTVVTDYISVRIESVEETWVFLDDFSLGCPTIGLGNDTSYCVVENVILNAGHFFESYTWSDGHSTGPEIEVNQPGLYWVEAKDGNCAARDTIKIDEIAFNCDCGIYIPNSFSPNNDGVNDEFYPLSPCDLLDYQLTIFDRWGQMVFRSSDPTDRWDGSRKGEPLGRSVYVYMLWYRFFYQEQASLVQGNICLLR
ncbi:MAG: gliding motility-associated C-terminal domain-containing protein [Phaeodactylibacter sp.]|nr:gliding motility-associated C-terminal domain-containing protein [Phaeodactylibacter sp.]MCB9273169.1 gliding motility-associated C-terminal domain-containing protein [Lewinellaceae bacterium]